MKLKFCLFNSHWVTSWARPPRLFSWQHFRYSVRPCPSNEFLPTQTKQNQTLLHHQCLAEVVSGNETVAGSVINCTGREGKQLISQVSLFYSLLMMMMAMMMMTYLVTDWFFVRLFITLGENTQAPLNWRLRECLHPSIALVVPGRSRVSSLFVSSPVWSGV